MTSQTQVDHRRQLKSIGLREYETDSISNTRMHEVRFHTNESRRRRYSTEILIVSRSYSCDVRPVAVCISTV